MRSAYLTATLFALEARGYVSALKLFTMSSRSWGGLSLSRHSGVQAIFGARVTKRRRTSSSSATASAASKDARALVKDEVRDDVCE